MVFYVSICIPDVNIVQLINLFSYFWSNFRFFPEFRESFSFRGGGVYVVYLFSQNFYRCQSVLSMALELLVGVQWVCSLIQIFSLFKFLCSPYQNLRYVEVIPPLFRSTEI